MTSKREKISSIEAAEWWVQLRDEESAGRDREQFVDWLRASPENVAEYLKLSSVWQDLGESIPEMDLDSIIAEINDNNVVPLPRIEEESQSAEISQRSWNTSWQAIAASVVFVAVALLLILKQPDDIIRTAVGEQRSVVLADGSLLTLNTSTAVRFDMDETSRHVDLVEGEVLFEIARDTARPFTVSVGATTVKVVGTSFNIYKISESEATITVLEGLVAVQPEWVNPDLIVQSAGELVAVTGEVQLKVGEQVRIGEEKRVHREKSVQVEKAVEWTSRRLTFENALLKDVIAEFNRYNTRKLQVDDHELALLRLNGVFKPHSHEALLEYLEKTENVRVRDIGDRRVISR